MIEIMHYRQDDLLNKVLPDVISLECSVGDYIAHCMEHGRPFVVFKGNPCDENIIFPLEDKEESILSLMDFNDGEYSIIETAGEAFAVQLVIAIVLAVAVVALTPNPELPSNVNRQQESPNNGLSDRSNRARPLQRVPDIKGRVLAVPDIVMPTYSVFENNIEVEHGFYCVGRKRLDIQEVNDGQTPIELITGAAAGVYYPFNSPNSGAADIQIGEPINKNVVIPFRSNEVDGIVLDAPNINQRFDADLFDYQDIGDSTGSIKSRPGKRGSSISPKIGDIVVLEDVLVNDGFGGQVDISGEYEVIDISGSPEAGQSVTFFIDISATIWGFSGAQQGLQGLTYEKGEGPERFTDWFYMTRSVFDSAIVNIIAPNGLYKDSGEAIFTASVDFTVEVEGVDISGNPNGNLISQSGVISGTDSSLKGFTVQIDFPNPQRFRVRAIRNTDIDTNFDGVVVDEIKLNDVYGIEEIGAINFGNVTTIQTKTISTTFATSFKERQLNCIATEMLHEYQGSGVFSSELSPNTRAVQSFITDAIDPIIGGRTIDEIEADDILALDDEIDSYFGISDCGEFSYTFDSTNITFQEYARTLFDAINCIAFREAGKISAVFERPQEIPTLLFTHRSKLPDSERHTRNFNQATINDGVEFNWVDPETNTTETIYIPSDRSALNPKTYNIPGLRNFKQATIRANREYNKLLYNKVNLEVTVTAEGRYVRPQALISVVKGTRVQTFDGEILAQNGLQLTLSQDVEFVDNDDHFIVLKNDLGEVESILVTEGSAPNLVILDSAPVQTIRTDGLSRRTEFSFGNEARQESERWLAQEIDISEKWLVQLKAINYTDQYYSNDLDNLSSYSNDYSEDYG